MAYYFLEHMNKFEDQIKPVCNTTISSQCNLQSSSLRKSVTITNDLFNYCFYLNNEYNKIQFELYNLSHKQMRHMYLVNTLSVFSCPFFSKYSGGQIRNIFLDILRSPTPLKMLGYFYFYKQK